MINLTREVDLPYILDKFKQIEPVQNVDYSDIPPDADDKTRAIYRLVIDAITNAKKFAGYEIENVSDILNNFIAEIYSEFAGINSSLSSDNEKENFTDTLDESIEKISENLKTSSEIEKNQIDDVVSMATTLNAIKDLVISLKESYEKYISSIINGFKNEFEDIEKRFESLIDSKLSKEFSDNKSFGNKVDAVFKNNIYIKKILEKFNVQYMSSLKEMIPSQISIISDKMKREIDAEKERMMKEKSKGQSIRQLFKKYGLIGGSIAIGIKAMPTRKQMVSSFKTMRQFSLKTIENIKNIKIKDTIRSITDVNRIKKSISNIANITKARAKKVGAGVVKKLKKGAYYLIDTKIKTINKDFGWVGASAGLAAKGLYRLFGGKRRVAYLSVKNKVKKTRETKPNFDKFEIDKKSSIQELVFRVYDLSEIIRLNLISFNQDIIESYNARKKLDKDRIKALKKKELSNVNSKFGLGGALFWLLRPLFRFIGRKVKGFFSRITQFVTRKIRNWWKGTRLARGIESWRNWRIAKRLMKKYPGLSKVRALRLAKQARLSNAASRAAAKAAEKAGAKAGTKAGGKAVARGALKTFGVVIQPIINMVFGIMDATNDDYMSGVFGIAKDQIDTKHRLSFILAATVTGGGSVLDDPSWYNWLNLGLNMGMWFAILGPVGIAVGAIFSLIGQERLARFIHENPYTSLGITVGLICMHPAIVSATGGLSLVVGAGAVGLGIVIDRLSNASNWKTATDIGKNLGLIGGLIGGAILGFKAGMIIGTFIGGPIGTVVGAAVGLLVGAAVAAIGYVVGGLIGSLFESKPEVERPLVEEMKEKMRNLIQLNVYKYNNSILTLRNKIKPGVGDDTEERYQFGNLWNGITSLQKINGYLTSDVRLLMSKGATATAGNTVGIIGVPTTYQPTIVNNPSNEAAEQEARLERYRKAGPTPRIGPRRDW